MSDKGLFSGKTIQDFEFLQVIGQGVWAVVYKAIDTRQDHSKVAIKCVPKKKIILNPKLQQLMKTEIIVLKHCNNPNVIKFVRSFSTQTHIFIATQYCNGGDLQQYFNQKQKISEDQATEFLKQLLNGFQGLHQVKAMHRDFKMANILLHNGICKIADLGFAKQFISEQNMTNTFVGTALTMAPQVLQGNDYGTQADIYSLGVVYYQMIYGNYPFQASSHSQLLNKIKKTLPDLSKVNISPYCKDFILQCLQPDPKKRITWSKIPQHPLLKQQQKNIKFVYNAMAVSKLFNNNIQNSQINLQNLQGTNLQQLQEIDFTDVLDIRQTLNYQKKIQMVHKKQQIEKSLAAVSKIYMQKRNDIMFVFKYIGPNVLSLVHIRANHEINMFVLSKKAFIEMRQFYQDLRNKKNIFKVDKYWQDFTSSDQYMKIEQILKSDMDIIYSQCISYRSEIESCSQQITAQFQIEKAHSYYFNQITSNTIKEYWFLLAQHFVSSKQKNNTKLVTLLQALDFLHNNKQNIAISAQQFDKIITSADFQKLQEQIKNKYMKQFQ